MQHPIDQTPILYFASGDDGVLMDINQPLCTVLGYQKEDLIGKKVETIFTVATKIFHQTHFFPMLKMQEHAEEIFITLLKSNGDQIPVLINAERKIINGSIANMFAGIVVHNRKKFEEELIAARKAAEAALRENTDLIAAKDELQKRTEELDLQMNRVRKQNEELKQFNKIVTHDFQEPLRKLLMFTGVLTATEESAATVQKIRRVTHSMREILHGLQQYVWLDDSTPNISNILLDDLLTSLQQQTEKDHADLKLVLEREGLDTVPGDEEQIRLLFGELLANAVRFRKEGDAVRVRVSVHTLQQNIFRTMDGKYKYVDFVRIRFSDEGIGFNSKYGPQVFQLFKRLHHQSGNGVGLSLCKKIVEQHGGLIFVESEVNKGTTVIIDLPQNTSAEAVERVVEQTNNE